MDIFGKKQLKGISDDIAEYKKTVKEQIEQHLESINDNTNEIQANYEYLCQLDNKIEKLSLRLDKIQLLLRQLTNNSNFVPDIEENYQVQPLTVKEREVFLVLYASETNQLLSYPNIAHSINLTESLVQQYVTNLIEKGVPIIKEYRLGKPYLKLDSKFKELQAKQNILNIDEDIMKNVFSRS